MAESEDTTTPSKSPAFQFYPKDFLHDENVRVMSLTERGAYITLLCTCWTEGSLPSDLGRLARLCETSVGHMRRLWPALAVCFRPHQTIEGRIVHPRLERERRKQLAFSAEQSERGRRGAAKRWQSDASAMPPPQPENGAAINSPRPQNGDAMNSPMAKNSSAICDLQSSDSSQERTRALARDPIAERAGEFIERYKVLHIRLRKGAHYIGRPVLDFQEALQLVGVYDDTRLDKLAYVWLNTDHDFAQSGTRSLAKFRSMASWCEEQLIEWEEAHGPLTVAS